MSRSLSRRILPAAALSVAALCAGPSMAPARAQTAASMFAAGELDNQRFILVAAPIGSSGRSQLNIYEQVNPRRPCFAVAPGLPAAVDPLLARFDFTGVCSRYIDTNGYSLRIGDRDLATMYRLSVVTTPADIQLLARPSAGGGQELLVARTQGLGSGFLKLHFEPGWRLARRQFRGRSLGHVYLYRDSWPASEAPIPTAPAPAGMGTPPAAGAPAALGGAAASPLAPPPALR